MVFYNAYSQCSRGSVIKLDINILSTSLCKLYDLGRYLQQRVVGMYNLISSMPMTILEEIG